MPYGRTKDDGDVAYTSIFALGARRVAVDDDGYAD